MDDDKMKTLGIMVPGIGFFFVSEDGKVLGQTGLPVDEEQQAAVHEYLTQHEGYVGVWYFGGGHDGSW